MVLLSKPLNSNPIVYDIAYRNKLHNFRLGRYLANLYYLGTSQWFLITLLRTVEKAPNPVPLLIS